MKASDLLSIPDASQRLIQSHKFILGLQEAEVVAVRVRDETILKLRKTMSQGEIAHILGLSQQRISQMEARARETLGRE